MNLREALETLPDDRIFYLTMGSGYVFGGNKAAFSECVESLDIQYEKMFSRHNNEYNEKVEQLRRELANPPVMDSEIKLKSWMKKRQKSLNSYETRIARLIEPIPLYDREVIEMYERFTEDALSIVVKGYEAGKIWSMDESPKPVKINDDEAAMKLAAGIIRQMAKSYALALTMPDGDPNKMSRVRASRRELTGNWAQTLSAGADVEAIADMVRRNPEAVLTKGDVL